MVKTTIKRSKKTPIEKTCCICIDRIDRETEARITSCRHRYHYKCIKKWSKRDNTCPQCRRHFNWIIRVKNKHRYKVKCNDKKDTMIASLIYAFFNISSFREDLLIGLYERSMHAIQLFRIIKNIVDFMRQMNIYPDTLDEVRRVEAYTWLDEMEENITDDILV